MFHFLKYCWLYEKRFIFIGELVNSFYLYAIGVKVERINPMANTKQRLL